jgi:pimeloyl-ACP methyl ester carboxylesterase
LLKLIKIINFSGALAMSQTSTLTAEQFANTNGLELCFQSFGKASNPPLILIMGLATQMIHWDDVFCQTLAERGFWVIRFDNRDIGKSTKIKGQKAASVTQIIAHQWFNRPLNVPYFLNDMADDTIGLLDYLDISQAHVVGVSMGGMIAQCMALKSPERIRSITSIMSTTGNRKLPKPKPWVTLKILQPVPTELDSYVEHVLRMWKMLHGQTYTFDQARVAETLVKAHQRCFYPAGVKRQTSAIIASPDRTAELQSLKLPALVLHGDKDPLVPLACGLATADAVPHSKLKVYEGMGHTLPRELWTDMIDEICNIAS